MRISDLARDLKTSAEYRALPAKVAQWALRQVALAWKSYFAACAAWEANPSRFLGHPKLPHYLPKQGRNLLTYTEQAISHAPHQRGYVVPSGLPIRVQTRQTTIDQVRIVPHASHYTVEVIYERPVTPADVDPARVAAIEVGLNNLAAVTANPPGLVPLLVQSRPLKAINQWDNQRRAQLQAKLPAGVFVIAPTRHLGRQTGAADHRVSACRQPTPRGLVDRAAQRRAGHWQERGLETGGSVRQADQPEFCLCAACAL
jgi:putative transposase